jgi:hypothetical protein
MQTTLALVLAFFFVLKSSSSLLSDEESLSLLPSLSMKEGLWSGRGFFHPGFVLL